MLKTKKCSDSLKSKRLLFLVREKSLSIKSLATYVTYILEINKVQGKSQEGSLFFLCGDDFEYRLSMIICNDNMLAPAIVKCATTLRSENKECKDSVRRGLCVLWRSAYLCPCKFARWLDFEDSEMLKIAKVQ